MFDMRRARLSSGPFLRGDDPDQVPRSAEDRCPPSQPGAPDSRWSVFDCHLEPRRGARSCQTCICGVALLWLHSAPASLRSATGQAQGHCPYISASLRSTTGRHRGAAPTSGSAPFSHGQSRRHCPYLSASLRSTTGRHRGTAPTYLRRCVRPRAGTGALPQHQVQFSYWQARGRCPLHKVRVQCAHPTRRLRALGRSNRARPDNFTYRSSPYRYPTHCRPRRLHGRQPFR